MQDELNDAGARGYRFAGTQGGETAFGGREAVVIMALDPEGRRFRYILLATDRSGTMQREMNEALPEVATDYPVTVSRQARAAGLLSERALHRRRHEAGGRGKSEKLPPAQGAGGAAAR